MKKIVLTDAGNGIQLVYMLTKQDKWIQIMFGCDGQLYSINCAGCDPVNMTDWQHTTLYEAQEPQNELAYDNSLEQEVSF